MTLDNSSKVLITSPTSTIKSSLYRKIEEYEKSKESIDDNSSFYESSNFNLLSLGKESTKSSKIKH